MAVKHTVLLQKSFSKLPYSSFETLAQAKLMFNDDIAASSDENFWQACNLEGHGRDESHPDAARQENRMPSHNNMNWEMSNGDLVMDQELTETGNGFKNIFFWSDKRWEEVKDQPFDILPDDIGWSRTVLPPEYIVSGTGTHSLGFLKESPVEKDFSKQLCDNCQTIFNQEAKEVFPV